MANRGGEIQVSKGESNLIILIVNCEIKDGIFSVDEMISDSMQR